MRNPLRRSSALGDPSPESGTAEPTPEPGPPRGAAVATFAAILDGASLWVAVEATPGTIALRDAESGDVLALTNDAPDDQPGFTSTRVDLSSLPPVAGADRSPGTASYDVVVVPEGDHRPAPVWTAPLTPHRTAPSPDGTTQFGLGRTRDGTLQVHRTTVPEAVWLDAVTETVDGVRLVVSYDATAEDSIALLADEAVLATYPLRAEDSASASGIVTADLDVADDLDTVTHVVVGRPGAWLPVRRRGDDLPEPGRGVPLPPVRVPGTQTPRLRLRFGGEAYLLARILPAQVLPATGTPTTDGA